MSWLIGENIATLIVSVGGTVALYALGAGGWSFLCLLILLNLNARCK